MASPKGTSTEDSLHRSLGTMWSVPEVPQGGTQSRQRTGALAARRYVPSRSVLVLRGPSRLRVWSRIEQGQLGSIGRLEARSPCRGLRGGLGGPPRAAPCCGPLCVAEFVECHVEVVQLTPTPSSRAADRISYVRIEPTTQSRGRRSPVAQNFLGKAPEFVFDPLRVGSSQGVAPRAQSHSSFVRRTALRAAASRFASSVLPAPGNPQVRMNRTSFTVLIPAVQRSTCRRTTFPDPANGGRCALFESTFFVSVKLGLLQPGAAAQAIRSRSTIRPFLRWRTAS